MCGEEIGETMKITSKSVYSYSELIMILHKLYKSKASKHNSHMHVDM